jgi:phosphotransferase system  glucose/maltose/N-acetylglucosamine-specific IIC component
MIQQLWELAKKNKKYFIFIILPIPFIAIYYLYEKYLIASSNKKIDKSEKKDKKMQEKQDFFEKKAEEHINKAEKLEEKAKNTKVDLDWHLKE